MLVETDLSGKTLIYWRLQRAWNGVSTPKEGVITTQQAIKFTKDILMTTGPQHPLNARVDILRNDIIIGGTRDSRPAAG